MEEVDQSWEAYDSIMEVLFENEYTYGDTLFVISVLLAEMVKEGGFDFEEMFQDLRESSLQNIKIMSDA
jgi:hypothetical protein